MSSSLGTCAFYQPQERRLGPFNLSPHSRTTCGQGPLGRRCPGLIGTVRPPLCPPHLLWALGPNSLCIPWLWPGQGRSESLFPLFPVPWLAPFLRGYLGSSNCSLLPLGRGMLTAPTDASLGAASPLMVVLHSL